MLALEWKQMLLHFSHHRERVCVCVCLIAKARYDQGERIRTRLANQYMKLMKQPQSEEFQPHTSEGGSVSHHHAPLASPPQLLPPPVTIQHYFGDMTEKEKIQVIENDQQQQKEEEEEEEEEKALTNYRCDPNLAHQCMHGYLAVHFCAVLKHI